MEGRRTAGRVCDGGAVAQLEEQVDRELRSKT